MKKILLLICTIGLSVGISAKGELPCISGTIKGFANDTVFVRQVVLSKPTVKLTDTIFAVKDRFSYSKNVTEATEFTLYSNHSYLKRFNGRLYLPETRMIKLIIKPGGTVILSGVLDNKVLNYTAKGDAFNETFSIRRANSLKVKADLVRRELQIDSMAYSGGDEKIVDQLDEALQAERIKSQQADLEYIKANPKQDLSAYYLNSMPMDTFLLYVGKLDPSVRNGMLSKGLNMQEQQAKTFKAVEEAQKRVSVGSIAPDFELKSLAGNKVKLSDYKGKYLVLDFWGAWCIWCMRGVPQMKEYYAKYKDKVEFIGVDVRDKEEVWKSTVAKNEMNWVHVINLTTADVPVLYGVSGYPTKFILDPELHIVARIIGESPEFYQKLDELLK
ncbi:MAG TPA: TlpA disulfide reductase family protein [Bacteroidales bacterium]|nr:TlpA disulfide reductase family protein [Bacteroidales bacterium]